MACQPATPICTVLLVLLLLPLYGAKGWSRMGRTRFPGKYPGLRADGPREVSPLGLERLWFESGWIIGWLDHCVRECCVASESEMGQRDGRASDIR